MILQFTLDASEAAAASADSPDAPLPATSLHFWAQLQRFAEQRARVLQNAFRSDGPASELRNLSGFGARVEYTGLDDSPLDAA